MSFNKALIIPNTTFVKLYNPKIQGFKKNVVTSLNIIVSKSFKYFNTYRQEL